MKNEQLTFNIPSQQKKKYVQIESFDYIDKYKYIGIDSYKNYEFEIDSSNQSTVMDSESKVQVEVVKIPLLSEIAAGCPIYINEDFEDSFYLPTNIIRTDKDMFILKVRGNSMINANINDEDYVLIKRNTYIRKQLFQF